MPISCKKYSLLAELTAEFLGTLILILLGNGVVAMVVLFGKGTPGEIVHGGFTNITIGWGLGRDHGLLRRGAYLRRAHEPGGHHCAGDLSRLRLAQGGAVHSGAGGGRIPGGGPGFLELPARLPRGRSQPGPHGRRFHHFPCLSGIPSAGLLDQTIGTAILLFMVMALTDERNQPPGANLTPVLVGAVVVAIGMSFGGMHGYAINPARDFRPAAVHGGGGIQE